MRYRVERSTFPPQFGSNTLQAMIYISLTTSVANLEMRIVISVTHTVRKFCHRIQISKIQNNNLWIAQKTVLCQDRNRDTQHEWLVHKQLGHFISQSIYWHLHNNVRSLRSTCITMYL